MLSPNAELFFRRLMSVVDDYGRYEARIKLLKADCFPLRDSVTTDEVLGWLLECQAAGGLISIYDVGGKSYLEISGFRQRARSASHYPAPPEQSAALDRGPLANDRAPRRNSALGEGGDEVGVGDEGGDEGEQAPPLADRELAELLQRAMPRGTPPPDSKLLVKVKSSFPSGCIRDLELALSPFLTGKRRPPNTYGFWPVYLTGIRLPVSRQERPAVSEQAKACGECKGTGVVGGSGTSAEEVSKELLRGRSLCSCEAGQGWENYLGVANPPAP